MNGAQGVMIGVGALLVVGVGVGLMLSGGDKPIDDGLGGGELPTTTQVQTPATAPAPLPRPKTVGSGATLATARAMPYDPNNPPQPPAQVWTDIVCRREVPDAKAVSYRHEEVTYHFCSEGCLAKFKADPETIRMKAALGE